MRLPFRKSWLTPLRRMAVAIRFWWEDLRRPRGPKTLLGGLGVERLKHFLRKTPQGDQYPFEVHYPDNLSDVPEGLDRYFLVGRNWVHRPDLPFALAFGFNDWKFGFSADYCADVRMAFAPRKALDRFLSRRRYLKILKRKPARIYVWGYTDPSWLAPYARRHGIELVRVEDAFLRSAELGASHATPYSLTFDRKGLYYNTSESNDLTEILAHHDFASDPELMERARRARKLVATHQLVKYNLPDTADARNRYRVRTRRRILVVGQVDGDAAVRMGNP